MPGTEAPGSTVDAGVGLPSGLPPEVDCNRVTLLEPAILVSEDATIYEVEEEIAPAGLIILGVSVFEDAI